MPTPGHARIGIGQRGDNPRHPRRDQRLGARRGLAMMRAGLQRHIGHRPPRARPRLLQSHGFGMGPPAPLRPAPAQHHTLFHNHTAYRRIGPDRPKAPRAKAQGMGHVIGIAHSSGSAPGRSSDTKRSKSSAAWKFL